jgi:hypothetical protein
MTDWKLMARARGLDPDEPAAQLHIATMTQLESALAELKTALAFDVEPAPVFVPIVTKREAS